MARGEQDGRAVRMPGRPRPAVTAVAAALAVALAVAVVAALSQAGASREARVLIDPSDGLLDAPLRFEVDGARPDATVRLTLSATSADGTRWTRARLVRADGAGAVAIDGGPLFASLAPVAVNEPAKAWLLPAKGRLALRLDASEDGHALGAARATRRMSARGITNRALSVARDGLAARYWDVPPPGRRRTAVLELGGSEGGFANGAAAALLASHGYPVLQLAYFRAPGLPGQLRDIPLEYLARALRWVRARSGVEHVVVAGASRGGELALLLGSTYPALVDGVAAYAPAPAVVPGSWTLRGRPLPSPSNPDPRIPVERIRGPVLLVAGGADQVWNSAYAVSAVRARRRAAGTSRTEALTFDRAGHAITLAIPYLPAPTEVESDGFTLSSGGTRQADALARTASWPRLLALLDRVGRSG